METSTRNTASAAQSTANAAAEFLRPREITTIESYHVMHDKLRLYITAILSILWLSAQLRRYLARDLSAGCWYGWDAFALAAMAFFIGQKQYATACVFASAYFVWTRLPGSLFNDLHLPSFGVFLETSERHADDIAKREATITVDISEDAHACLVCWSSDNRPMVLPCDHSVCQECLSTMKDRRKTCCPLCRLPLFHNNDGVQCATHKAVVAALAARLTTNGIYLLLQLWHGQYSEVAQSAVTYLPQFYCFRVLHFVVQTQGVEWWQFGMFDYLMPLPLPEGRFWRSAWPQLVFALLFSMEVFTCLHRIGKLDLIAWRVVHQEPFAGLYGS